MFQSFRVHFMLPAMLAAAAASTGAFGQQFQEQQSTRFPQPAANNYTNQLTFGDIDADQDLDIIWANGGGFSSPGAPELARIYINNGTGFFTDESIARGAASGLFRGVELGDVDGDDDLDMVLAADFGNLPRLLINNGSGFFTDETAARLPALTLASSRGQFADIDNDGDLDLAFVDGVSSRFGTGQTKLYLNNGSGFFTDVTAAQMAVDLVSQPMDCIFGDIDGDYDLDLHVGARAGLSRMYRNNGSGTFAISAIPNDGNAYSYDFGDMDGDGDLDMLGANGGPANQEQLLRSNGNGTFLDASVLFSPNPSADDNDSKFFDYDNDGDLDIIIGTLGQGTERIYTNSGTGTFTGVAAGSLMTPISDSSMDIMVGDVTGDGRIDIVTGQGESGAFTNRIYVNMTGPVDNRAPRIIRTEQVADTDDTTGPYVVRTVIYDDYTSDRGFFDRGVELNYSVDGGATQQVDMKWSGNSVWRGEIPGQAGGSSIEYFVTATDWAGNVGTGATQSFDIIDEPADLNGDGVVNGLDLGILLANWSIPAGTPGCGGSLPCAADLNGDTFVDGLDLGILLASWTL